MIALAVETRFGYPIEKIQRTSLRHPHYTNVPVFLLSLLLSAALALRAADGASVRYAGGTLVSVSEGTEGRILTSDDVFFDFRCRGREHHVPYTSVNLLEYGQNVNRRLALAIVISPLFVLSKSRRHYLTIGYKDAVGKQQAMVFQVGKHHIRAVLVALEARTGLKVSYQDDDARRAGKG